MNGELSRFLMTLGMCSALASCSLILGANKKYVEEQGAGGGSSMGTAEGSGGAEASATGSGGASPSTSSGSGGVMAATSSSVSAASSTTSTTSTTSGGGTTACGPGAFADAADTFDGASLDPLRWGTYPDSAGGPVKQMSGEVYMAFAGISIGVFSKKEYSLRNCRASVKVSGLPQPSPVTTHFEAQINNDGGHQLVFTQANEYLNMEVKMPGGPTKPLNQILYDPGEQVYWQIRASDMTGLVYWETSKDGSGWTERATYAIGDLSFSIDKLQLNFGVSPGAGGASPPTVRFDNFNKP